MRAQSRLLALLVATLAGVTACRDASGPNDPSPATPAFAKGVGGGGTAVPTPPPSTPTPTISFNFTPAPSGVVLVGQAVNLSVIATSEAGNRKAPTITVAAAPAGLTLASIVVADNPHGGGPGYTLAQYTWTPTRDQIGLAATVTLVATTSAGSGSTTVTLPAVQDAPTALTGLTAVTAGDHIEARWDPSANGVAPVSYVVSACYRNANIRTTTSTCDVITTTTDAQALNIPLTNPSPTVAPAGGVATYFFVIVTPVDAAGHAGIAGTATVQ